MATMMIGQKSDLERYTTTEERFKGIEEQITDALNTIDNLDWMLCDDSHLPAERQGFIDDRKEAQDRYISLMTDLNDERMDCIELLVQPGVPEELRIAARATEKFVTGIMQRSLDSLE